MKRIVLLVSFLVLSCGTDSGGGGANLVNPSDQRLPDDETAEAPHAQLVATQAEAPACDTAGEGRLIYVKDESAFKACASGAWEAIDLKGPKGDKGDPGDAGAKGDDGENGDDGLAQSPNTWLDPVSGETWLLGGIGASQAAAITACGDEWELPSEADFANAVSHGLYAGTVDTRDTFHDCAWVSDAGFGNSNRIAVKPGLAYGSCPADKAIYCVKP